MRRLVGFIAVKGALEDFFFIRVTRYNAYVSAGPYLRIKITQLCPVQHTNNASKYCQTIFILIYVHRQLLPEKKGTNENLIPTKISHVLQSRPPDWRIAVPPVHLAMMRIPSRIRVRNPPSEAHHLGRLPVRHLRRMPDRERLVEGCAAQLAHERRVRAVHEHGGADLAGGEGASAADITYRNEEKPRRRAMRGRVYPQPDDSIALAARHKAGDGVSYHDRPLRGQRGLLVKGRRCACRRAAGEEAAEAVRARLDGGFADREG